VHILWIVYVYLFNARMDNLVIVLALSCDGVYPFVYMRAREASTAQSKEALDLLNGRELELCADDIDLWFDAHPFASPTMLALDFGIDPARLREEAESNELVRLALYRIIAVAEARLYVNVYGPKSVIQRVEMFLPAPVTVVDDDFADMFADPDNQERAV
jgi:hypothetical protein